MQANSPGAAVTRRRPRSELLKQAAAQSLAFHEHAGGPAGAPALAQAGVVGRRMAELRQKHLAHALALSKQQDDELARRPKPGPGKAGGFKRAAVPDTLFPTRHARNELPCAIEHVSFGMQLTWAAPLSVLDYDHYLPVFAEGLCCTEHPFDFMARQGCKELLAEAAGSPERVLPSLPKILPMLRTALVTKHPAIVLAGLQFLRQLALSSPEVPPEKSRSPWSRRGCFVFS